MTHLERFLKGETQCIDFINNENKLHWFLNVLNNNSTIDIHSMDFDKNNKVLDLNDLKVKRPSEINFIQK